ncbi:MAG: hypothetical protein E3J94_07135 [Desulfobacteraceae bacterium]|nr:MAG: hypothetical protein E3J94_07135 [Desulfobacteraceae bacterium]
MDKEEHKKRHNELHKMFDELLADFITHTKKGLTSTLMELVVWSSEQTDNPTETKEEKTNG